MAAVRPRIPRNICRKDLADLQYVAQMQHYRIYATYATVHAKAYFSDLETVPRVKSMGEMFG